MLSREGTLLPSNCLRSSIGKGQGLGRLSVVVSSVAVLRPRDTVLCTAMGIEGLMLEVLGYV